MIALISHRLMSTHSMAAVLLLGGALSLQPPVMAGQAPKGYAQEKPTSQDGEPPPEAEPAVEDGPTGLA